MIIKLKKKYSEPCYLCAVRSLTRKVTANQYIKLKELCESGGCGKGDFIYEEVK